jgi:predicted ester cyclase
MTDPSRLLLLALGMASASVSCASGPDAQLEANKAAVRTMVEAGNALQLDRLDSVMTPDFVRHSQATPDAQVNSLADFKQFLTNDRATFPDENVELVSMVAEGDRVALLARFTGTQSGPMGPFPPTGKSVNVPFLGMLRMENGKIAEMWVEWDNVAILTQLGLFPPPAS